MKKSLLVSILSVLVFSCSNVKEPLQTDPQKPNVLFLIADDWSYPHAGVYGDPVVQTPTFDFLANEGALFSNAYTAAPSCSPSRAAILTSRYPHQLESAGNLWSVFPSKFPNWVSILEKNGYHTGKNQKGWAPGNFVKGGYKNNPAGYDYTSFEDFLEQRRQLMAIRMKEYYGEL